MNNIKKFSIFICFVLVLVISVIFLFNFHNISEEKLLSIHMIDVGQGDSILIITPNGKTILIDAGDKSEGSKVASYLKKSKIETLDILIATHPHSDHIGGMPSIINNFQVGKFYMPELVHTTKTFENMLNAAKANSLKISTLPIGAKIEFDQGIDLYFLSPFKDYGDNLNNWSIVMKLDYLDKSFIFTGDIEQEAEMDILTEYEPQFLRSHLLKIAHHGSSSSSSEEFLNVVRPHIGLISTGLNNSYNHPHKETLKSLKEKGVHMYRTDSQGTVVIKSNGKEIWSHREPYSYPDF